MTRRDSCTTQTAAPSGTDLSTEDWRKKSDATLIEFLIQLARQKWLILAFTCAAILVGIICCMVLPTRYTATTKIMTPRQNQSSASLMMSQLASSGASPWAAAVGSGMSLKNPNDIYVGLLNSRPVADAIIHQFGLQTIYRTKSLTATRKLLEGNTRLASESSGLLAISVTDRDKKRAADLANAYTEELRVLTNSLAVTEAAQRRMFYEEQLKRAKEDLIEAEYSFQQIQQKRGLIQLDAQAKVLIAGLAELRAQTAAKQVELQALRSYSTENNPEVRLVENQLASLQQETALVEHRSSSSGSSVAGLQDVAGAGLEYLRAEHEVLYRQTLFDVLIKQYDAAKMDEVKDAAVLQVVESAIPPEQKSSPRRASIVLTFAVLGFVGVCGYLFARDHAKRNPAVSQSLTEFRLALLSK